MTTSPSVALVTGASRGLGHALATQLAARGSRVVLVARGREALDQAVDAIRARGGEAWGIVADLGDPDAAARVAGQAAALAGPVELLVHNASTLGPTPLGPLADTTPEAFERVLQVNLVGPFRLTRLLAGHMALHGGGAVVTISSDAAVEAYPTWGAYSVSKAGLDHLARIWAEELPSVRFLAIDPTEMDTAMHAAALPEADPSTLARPEHVAGRILDHLAGELPSGSRLVA